LSLTQNIALSYRNIASNKTRTAITSAIIAFGIMALIGILTAIEAMKFKLKDSFSFLGANTFTIRASERKISLSRPKAQKEKVDKENNGSTTNTGLKAITLNEAQSFVSNYNYPSTVGIFAVNNRGTTVKYNNLSTNPNTSTFAADENFLNIQGFTLLAGSNFTESDAKSYSKICVLGFDVAEKLFKPPYQNSIGQVVNIGSNSYVVRGILDKKGNSGLLSFDNRILVTPPTYDVHFNTGAGFQIAVKTQKLTEMDAAIVLAKNTFKPIRKIAITEEANFGIEKSDRLANLFITASKSITVAAIGIGLITLFGAAIGLMNIMLVAVTERTKEIGLLKAIGFKKASIKNQFIIESLLVSLIGAVAGILLGVLIGNIVGAALSVPFFIPWGWVFLGIFLCTGFGLLAGLYPAIKASALSPIQALRYE
jgi:putative ABC transport system permease protein